jgi:F-type H+-transporting ATPase subunit a
MKNRKMLLSSRKPFSITIRGIAAPVLDENARLVQEALPVLGEITMHLDEMNLDFPSFNEFSFFRKVLLIIYRRRNPGNSFYPSLLEEIRTPEGRSNFGHQIQDLHATMSASENWPEMIAAAGGRSWNSPSGSPLDQFFIHPIMDLHIGNYYFSFTNPSLSMLLTLVLVLLLVYVVTKKGGGKSVPNAWQSLVELIYDFVPNLVNEQIGGLSGNVKQKFFPRISVTFTFLLFCNLQGMIPFSFTVTSHFLITLALSFSLFIGITIVGFQRHGLHFFSFLLPAGVPLPLAPFLVLLELISHCFRALSSGIRLFANMMAGHSSVKILSGFAWTMLFLNNIFYFIGDLGPLLIVLALTGLELGVAISQAHVSTISICIYLNDATNLHQNESFHN